MKALFILLWIFSIITGCVTAASRLTNLSIGMTKTEVKSQIGSPESVSLSFIDNDGRRIDVWEYRLAQYEMATTLSPYFDIYSMIFVNDTLKSYSKTERGTRLSEGAALRLIGK